MKFITCNIIYALFLLLISNSLLVAQDNFIKIRVANTKNSCHTGVVPPKPRDTKTCYNAYMFELLSLQKSAITIDKLWLKDKTCLPLQQIQDKKGRKKGDFYQKNESFIVIFDDKKILKNNLPPRAFKGDALISYTVNGKRQYLEVKQIKQIKPM